TEIVQPERSTVLARPQSASTGELPAISGGQSAVQTPLRSTPLTISSSPAAPASRPVVQDTPTSVAAAFADFELSDKPARNAPSGGVDIAAIAPPREVATPAATEPPAPVVPRRYWVQVATGRDRDALAFDWRRISREAGDLLEGKDGFTARWGQTNRLLAGPFDNGRAASAAVNALKENGIDSFPFTSAQGEEVAPVG
ncbi:MAG: SPOR domain-containing protein, partial [Pontixanthobacter sp.]